MKKYLCTLFFTCVYLVCFSQNEANNWYFGENAGISFNDIGFNDGNAITLFDGQLNTGEGCASISDADGNLLFYTDGRTVYNAQHSVMSNGEGLDGNFSSTNSAIIIPKPNSSNIYYIFTADAIAGEKGLKYSEVDMDLDSGLGDITSNKNVPLLTPITEKLSAIKHASRNEYWLVAHKFGNNEFIAYLITENGIHNEPIISSVGVSIFNNEEDAIGQMKISPDGTKLVAAHNFIGNESVQLFDFNAETGVVSNPENISLPNPNSSAYGVEFSANSELLYVSYYSGIAQYNLDASLTPPYIVVTNTNSNFGYSGMQLGPNGKIYVAEWDNMFLHVINEPNSLSEDCDYEEDGVNLGDRISRLGLPPFIQSFFLVGFQSDNLCESDIVQFTANISQSYESISWDFGDGNTSQEENPSHVFEGVGEYEVTLTVSSGNETSTETQLITINEAPDVVPIVELKQCDDNLDGFSSFNLNEVITEISANSENETFTFYNSLTDAENEINAIINPSNYINESAITDLVWARVSNDSGCFDFSQIILTVSTTQIPDNFLIEFYECDTGTDSNDGVSTFDFSSAVSEIEGLFPSTEEIILSFYTSLEDALSEANQIIDISNFDNTNSPFTQNIFVRVDSALNNDCLGLGQHIRLNVNTIPLIDTLPNDIVFCENDTIELLANDGYDSYMWSTGETTKGIVVTEAGEYSVTASITANGVTCSTTEVVNVIEEEPPTLLGFDTEDWTFNENTITVLFNGSGEYEFSIDGINYQDNNIFTNLWADEYTVYIRNKNGCGIVSGTTYLLYYPRFFTPNDDGENDFWNIKNSFWQPTNEIYIYNRYGKLLKILTPNSVGWDGTYNGNKLPVSDYWFTFKRQNGETYTGHFTLKR